MAAALMRDRASRCAAPVHVQSAGFLTTQQPPPAGTLEAMRRRGLDLSAHRSRTVTAAMLERNDIVIGMTRAHVWEAAVLVPEVLSRTFVLGELVRLNEEVGHRRVGEPLHEWVGRLHAQRRHGEHHSRREDEIPDPMGRGRRTHERVARQIERLVLQLGDCAFEPLGPYAAMSWREAKLIWRPDTAS
jgi:protein-tyrosine phosphatase